MGSTLLGLLLNETTQEFLEVLRLKHRQYLIPDRPAIEWSGGYWILTEDAVKSEQANQPKSSVGPITVSGYRLVPEDRMKEVPQSFLDHLFPSAREMTPLTLIQPIEASDWPMIVSQVAVGRKSKAELSEVLIATAFGECDSQMGNPRLGLIEAVAALEIEVKALMRQSLSKYGISRAAIERVVRETPLADLASIWIRREIPEDDTTLENELYAKCAQAIHERNELVHLERRNLSASRAREHINAIAKLVEKSRQVRGSSKR